MSDMTDIQLFEKVQKRDPKAFDELVREQTQGLYHFILKMVSDEQAAEDIVQDTFVRVWEKSRQFKGKSSVKTWIYRIAINLCYSHLKRNKRWSYTMDDDLSRLNSSSDPQRDVEDDF